MSFSPADYSEKLQCGRQDEALAEARLVIAADVPRTFVGFEGGLGESHGTLAAQ